MSGRQGRFTHRQTVEKDIARQVAASTSTGFLGCGSPAMLSTLLWRSRRAPKRWNIATNSKLRRSIALFIGSWLK